jgi:alcohol dehydrogenase class IV
MNSAPSFRANWNYPTAVRAGVGRISELAQICRELGLQRPLLITDRGLAKLPMVGAQIAACGAAGLDVAVFSEVKSNPTGKNVDEGVAQYRAGGHDGVIAFGGGSALDAAKAVALMSGQVESLWSFEDIGDNWTRARVDGIAPVVAIPTTAGTGSEVGRASVITDEDHEVKKIIFHPKMMPKVVILDPELTLGLPARLSAATGMDALSHNLEAYCAPFFHPMAQGIAVEGIRLIREYLPRVVTHGDDVEARMQMLVASSMGATAFQRGLGAMHALAHPLGALYDAHHGMLNAVLMPYVLRANRAAIDASIARLAAYLGLDASFDAFLAWILQLRQEVGIPHTLAEIGIDDQKARRVAAMAVQDPSAGGNPIAFGVEAYETIFRQAVLGH